MANRAASGRARDGQVVRSTHSEAAANPVIRVESQNRFATRADARHIVHMSRITLDVPEETLVALRATPETFGQRVLLAAAVKLYELGELSSGAAARLAGIPRVVFLAKLADFGVDTFRLTETELLQETRLG